MDSSILSNIPDIVIVVAAVFLLIIILRFIGKIIFKTISFIVIVGIVLYLLFYWRGGVLDIGNKAFMLEEMKQKYCVEMVDKVKCECIVTPIYNDIKEQYSDEEIALFQENKIKSARIILTSLLKKQKEIRRCLKEKDALEEWDNFVDDIKNVDFEESLNDLFKKLEK